MSAGLRSAPPPLSVLVIEDSDPDYEAVYRLVKRSARVGDVFRCSDGEQALDFLFEKEKFPLRARSGPRPGLIFLDLNLPGIGGLEILKLVKNDRVLRLTPVLILTSSTDQGNVRVAYQSGANTYFLKPGSPDAYAVLMNTVETYWLGQAVLSESPTS